ncbi:MAG: sugar-transfer associated ATP-grasp domain-containing protein [Opitutaceae bacterium]
MPTAAPNPRSAQPEIAVAAQPGDAGTPAGQRHRHGLGTIAGRAKTFVKNRPRLRAHLGCLRAALREWHRPTPAGRAQTAYLGRYFAREHLGPLARWRCRVDLQRCQDLFGADAFDYVLYGFRELPDAEKAGFVTNWRRGAYYRRLNRAENKTLFKNKDETHQRFGDFFRRDFLLLQSAADLPRFEAFCARHDEFIAKPRNAACGQGVRRLLVASAAERPQQLRELLLRHGGEVVIEECIRQAPEMAVFHPSSVNTVRITTLLLGEAPVLYHPFLRTGVGGAVVDNGGAGGILAAIDPASGILCTDGRDEDGVYYPRHPDTGIAYRGFQIPRWAEVAELAGRLCRIVPGERYTGWDFALTPRGWVLVEANHRGQFVGFQMLTRQGCRHEFEALLAAHGL